MNVMRLSINFAKRDEEENKINKSEGLIFGQHPPVEKSPPATGNVIL